mmetsp:Transcript_28305/g.51590  ORF Transcript_28305/g.51590 Transcript_28305/m.51590 type:complete len:155 (-) Transcript_28305:384-848(-)|eukprot:CAMPEP_0201600636 /NCGR_PEP_ID=MMETSP0492-20130828/1656_1 /ASSEMBLY_ACC=CAM_ASM_000837 /TAXON_ID=420259 /ORGANISM="Thalassiosira gravida, Strain GMp14c1" /LENGTH=154 /DNA_ID=CAMNT_0048063451 /DNA_START=78 /DNA_END=542 /DNA_ORIENTATION=-
MPSSEENDSVAQGRPGGTNRRVKYAKVLCRRALIITVSGAVIVGAAVGISVLLNDGAMDAYEEYETTSAQSDQQGLLDIAEQVVLACSEDNLNEDLSGCQNICRGHMCCFEDSDYSCEDDEDKNCAVYGGCEALIEDTLANYEDTLASEQDGRV